MVTATIPLREPDPDQGQGPKPVHWWVLFVAFLRLGCTAFGGPAMVVYIRDLAVVRRRWLSPETFKGGVALCQAIPGATAMQTAGFVGLAAGGGPGAVAAFTGFGLPAFILMTALSAVYARAGVVPAVVSSFHGLQAVVVALVLNAAVAFAATTVKSWRHALLALLAAVVIGSGLSPILAVVLAGLAATVLLRSTPAEPGSAAPAARRSPSSGRAPALLAALLAASLIALRLLDSRFFSLAWVMVRVDLFAFGGGFASVPLMLHEVVTARGWMDARTFMDGIALGQVTPGPIVITATFVGYRLAGLVGAMIATAAIFAPSLIILLATAPLLGWLGTSRALTAALSGVLCSFVGLLFAVGATLAVAVSWVPIGALVAAAAFAALRLKVDVLWVVAAAAILGALLL